MAESQRAITLANAAFFRDAGRRASLFFALMPGITSFAVAFDASVHRFFCSCPYFPKPCVHARSLAALATSQPDVFPEITELPDWATALLEGRPTISHKQHPQARQQEQARQQRRFERLERAGAGLDELENWLLDLLRRGLPNALAETPRLFQNMATRMADASLPGLSRSLRLLDVRTQQDADWIEPALDEIGQMTLAIRAFRHRDALSESLLFDLQQYLGINAKKEEVLQSGQRVQDYWGVLSSVEDTLEERLKVRRTWLLGGLTGRFALILDFAFGGEPMPPGYLPGTIQQGTLVYYPSAYPQRALLTEDLKSAQKNIEKLPGQDSFDAFADGYAAALGALPWLGAFPVVLQDATFWTYRDQIFLSDNSGKYLPLKSEPEALLRWLALGGGRPLTVFGEWDGAGFLPLSALADGRFVR